MRPSQELLDVFRRHLPSRYACAEIWFDPAQEDVISIDEENGSLLATLRVSIFDSAGSDTIRDVKEQQIYLGKYPKYSPERWIAYIGGHLRALPAIIKEFGDDVDSAMPMDFFGYWMVLDDETVQNADDFAQALSDPERLRAWNKQREDGDWRARLEPCGLADHVDEVRAMARPALRMLLDKVELDELDEDEIASLVGISRVGGDPDLPPSFEWPEVEGEPLTFVAQINLEEIARFENSAELPKQGLLNFFYAALPPGDSPTNPVRVFHIADADKVERRASPKGAERISEYTVSFAEERLYPCVDSHFFYESVLPEAQVLSFYEKLRDGADCKEPVPFYPLSHFIADMNNLHDYERPTHRLLGHPDSIQGDPYIDVEIDTVEGRWDNWKEGSVEAYRIRKNSLRWRLLLQIDAQESGELLLNQDGGFFFFFIPAEALAKHDWTQAWGVLQCH